MNPTNMIIPKNAKQTFLQGPVGKLDCLELTPLTCETIGIAIVCHPDPTAGGTYTNKIVQTIAKVLCQKGYFCICPNLRGVGLSDGTHNRGIGEVDDALAIHQYLRVLYPNLPLILAGFSFGSSIASQLTTQVEYQKLILVGPSVVKSSVIITNIAKTIAICGEDDEVVSPDAVRQWSRENELPVIWFPNTEHFFHGKLITLQNVLNSFSFL